jgi:hypothetical protein
MAENNYLLILVCCVKHFEKENTTLKMLSKLAQRQAKQMLF